LKLDFDPKKNMSAFDKFYSKLRIEDIKYIIKVTKNWHEIILFRLGLKKKIDIVLKNGAKFRVNNYDDYNDFWKFGQLILNNNVKVDKSRHLIIVKFEINKVLKEVIFGFKTIKNLRNMGEPIAENLIYDSYKMLDVSNKDVVDVGANIGDTAIYFALKGAKHVYAFEPYPYSYNIAKKNIELNHLKDKITLLNEGCGRSGFVTIKEDYENTGSTDLKSFKEGKKIKIESLDEIVKRFNLKHAALKVDCEGCEYNLILNASDKTLHAFDQIIIEYHYGYRNLVKRLRQAGFKVKYSLPKYYHNIETEDSNMYLGLIFCSKI